MRVLQYDQLRNVTRVCVSFCPVQVLDPGDVKRCKNLGPEKHRTAIGLPPGFFGQVPSIPTWAQPCLKRLKHALFNLLETKNIGC